MNFNIIENPSPDYDYEEVKKDYMNYDIPVKDIKRKHGLTDGRWVTLLKTLKEDPEVEIRGENEYQKRTAKYYYYDKRRRKYIIKKWLHGKQIQLKTCDTEEEAKKTVKILKEHDWDKNVIL